MIGESAGGNLATVVCLLARDEGIALPPVTIILAEIDPSLSQGEFYGEALQAAGVETTISLYEGVTHEFFGLAGVVDLAADAVDEAAMALTESFDTTA